jgi:hypothetical protein
MATPADNSTTCNIRPPVQATAPDRCSSKEEPYADRVLRFTECIMATGHPPHIHGFAMRAASWAFMPCWCGACCLWSVCCRVVACPCMCASRGPGAACSENGCTEASDTLIEHYVAEIDEREALPSPSPTTRDMADIPELLLAIDVVDGHFRGLDEQTFTDRHRTLAAAVVGPMCAGMCAARPRTSPYLFFGRAPRPADATAMLQTLRLALQRRECTICE